MITQFTKATLQALRSEIQAALDAVGTKHGVKLTYGNTRFDGDGLTYTAKLSGAIVASDGSVASKEAQDFKLYAHKYGLKPEHLGAKFKHDGPDDYEILGLKTKARGYPILAKNLTTGRTYKFTASLVQLYLA
jgi:hypothetical protein